MNEKEQRYFIGLMDLYEFEVYMNAKGKLQVHDLQGACLGDICDEQFNDEYEILERMEIYHNDYILRGIEETFDVAFDNYQGYYDYLKKQNDDEFNFELNILSLILYKKLYKNT